MPKAQASRPGRLLGLGLVQSVVRTGCLLFGGPPLALLDERHLGLGPCGEQQPASASRKVVRRPQRALPNGAFGDRRARDRVRQVCEGSLAGLGGGHAVCGGGRSTWARNATAHPRRGRMGRRRCRRAWCPPAGEAFLGVRRRGGLCGRLCGLDDPLRRPVGALRLFGRSSTSPGSRLPGGVRVSQPCWPPQTPASCDKQSCQ
jgi:hypothetical protein